RGKFKAWREPWRHSHQEFNPCLVEICNKKAEEKDLNDAVDHHALFRRPAFDLDICLRKSITPSAAAHLFRFHPKYFAQLGYGISMEGCQGEHLAQIGRA